MKVQDAVEDSSPPEKTTKGKGMSSSTDKDPRSDEKLTKGRPAKGKVSDDKESAS